MTNDFDILEMVAHQLRDKIRRNENKVFSPTLIANTLIADGVTVQSAIKLGRNCLDRQDSYFALVSALTESTTPTWEQRKARFEQDVRDAVDRYLAGEVDLKHKPDEWRKQLAEGMSLAGIHGAVKMLIEIDTKFDGVQWL